MKNKGFIFCENCRRVFSVQNPESAICLHCKHEHINYEQAAAKYSGIMASARHARNVHEQYKKETFAHAKKIQAMPDEYRSKSWLREVRGALLGSLLVILFFASIAYFLYEIRPNAAAIKKRKARFASDVEFSHDGILPASSFGKLAESLSVTMNTFLKAQDWTQRIDPIYKGKETAPELREYYSHQISSPDVDKPCLMIIGRHITRGELKGIETLWVRGKLQFEAIFWETENGFKLDWKDFIRYSTRNWDVFFSTKATDEGEFRVFCKDDSLNSDVGKNEIGLRFFNLINPKENFGELGSEFVPVNKVTAGTVSPLIRLPKESDLAKKMLAYFAARKKNPTGELKIVGLADTSGCSRVRVKIAIDGRNPKKTQLSLISIEQTDWLSVPLEEKSPPNGKSKNPPAAKQQ